MNGDIQSSTFRAEGNVTEMVLSFLVDQVLSGKWKNMSSVLSEWQMDRLGRVSENAMGVQCLLNAWLITQPKLLQGSYCNATWDDIYCWPPTQVGTTAKRTCSHAFQNTQPKYAEHLEGHGTRICLENGTWLWGDWTNYSECADSYEEYVRTSAEERELVTTVQHILFFGSILSIICLSSAVTIFYYFKCLWCDRVTIHIQLMIALILRYILLFIITEPYVLKHATNYRNNDIVCKGVLTIYLYATVASINWMFIQGMYINGRLTTNIFNGRTPFKFYYAIGWVFPLLLIAIYAIVMEWRHPVKCWTGYSDMDEIWIILGPILVALIVNFLFLINIVRILVRKAHTGAANPTSDSRQFLRAAKATVFLLPLLGVNNLLFVYNPGGNLHKYYVVLNSLFGSTQGIFVAIVYCYLSKDVRDAFRRVYRRFMARRNANRIRQRTRSRRGNRRSTGASHGTSAVMIVEQPVSSRRFSSQLSPQPQRHRRNELLSPCLSSDASQQTILREMKSGTSPGSHYSSNCSLSSTCSIHRNASVLNASDLVTSGFRRSTLYPSDQYSYHSRGSGSSHHLHPTTDVMLETRSLPRNQYAVVSIPLREISVS